MGGHILEILCMCYSEIAYFLFALTFKLDWGHSTSLYRHHKYVTKKS